ncbi:HEPN domain-containing protein [Rickettsia felis]|uniref:HEPN domain-containing protein n=1 Tax=Rickettsia felis TaxID=42862 RepID=UPI00057320EF|nr:HEPN domain-containing protein [Rickettsia felis]KHO03369.1 nucleotidyltransferase [Rickettsia felis]MDE8612027.1 HEPN domain-containing protein [Rickettsia felis]
MKTTLPERSLKIQARLNFIVQQILDIAQDKIAMIILYGSFARGDWVRDLPNGYHSDTDILIILKKGKYKGYTALRLEDNIYKRLEKTGVIKPQIIPYDSEISIILESIDEVNRQLEKGRYFYTDIKKEGILLYDSKEFTLSEAKELPWSEMKEIAKDYYEEWFDFGAGFLIDSKNNLERKSLRHSAFYLHQATASFYSSILLVFSNYKPKLHDIKKLGSRAANYNSELLQVFPIVTPEQKECFKLLQKAYVDARYDKNYKITKEQLLYLIERVEKLKEITERICLKRIG